MATTELSRVDSKVNLYFFHDIPRLVIATIRAGHTGATGHRMTVGKLRCRCRELRLRLPFWSIPV